MPMHPTTLRELAKNTPNDDHARLLRLCNDNVKNSRSDMSDRYNPWEIALDTYTATRPADALDKQATRAREPEKMVLPLTYSHVETFAAFQFGMWTQNGKSFELRATGPEDSRIVEDAEKLLERDLRRNNWSAILLQFFRDIARFNMGIIKVTWETRKMHFNSVGEAPEQTGELTLEESEPAGPVELVTYEGNKLMNVSPWRFFPDTRLPLDRFQEGEFCASEEEYTRMQMKKFEREGKIAGAKFIPEYKDEEDFNRRGDSRLPSMIGDIRHSVTHSKSQRMVCLTEVQQEIIPKDYKKFLGSEDDFPQKYLIWIANDKRIVRAEPMGTLHNQFGYSLGQFTPDMHQDGAKGLSDIIDPLQETISWLMNSRIYNVRTSLAGKIVADKDNVEMSTLRSRSPVILVKQGANRLGVNSFVSQINVQDVTQNHVADIQVLKQLLSEVDGISEAAMGQFHSGRRSATEARAVSAGAATRLKMIGSYNWSVAAQPLARQMLTNLRQELSIESYSRVVGSDAEDLLERYAQFASTPEELASSEDFFVFDSTLPSEKSARAQIYQSVLEQLLSNPGLAITFDLDPKTVFERMMALMGESNLEQYSLSDRLQREGPGADPFLNQLQQILMAQAQQEALNGTVPTQQQQPQPANAPA